MKTILILVLAVLPALADVTNNLTVVSTTAQLQIMQLANDIDNYRRTNGLAPYLVATNALNLRTFAESLAANAIVEKAAQYIQEDDGKLFHAVRRATALQRFNARQQLPP